MIEEFLHHKMCKTFTHKEEHSEIRFCYLKNCSSKRVKLFNLHQLFLTVTASKLEHEHSCCVPQKSSSFSVRVDCVSVSFCFQIDKQFGYFSKDAVQVEDVHTATEKVVETQVGLISLMQFSWREFKSFMIINAGDCVAE